MGGGTFNTTPNVWNKCLSYNYEQIKSKAKKAVNFKFSEYILLLYLNTGCIESASELAQITLPAFSNGYSQEFFVYTTI